MARLLVACRGASVVDCVEDGADEAQYYDGADCDEDGGGER